MKYNDLLNILPPEEIKFNFPGKLGRIALTWKEGQWIITNNRLIFVSEHLSFSSRGDAFFSQFGYPRALIILLSELRQIIKKDTKIIVRYLAFSWEKDHKELGIGFLPQHFQVYDNHRYSGLLDAVYKYLSGPKEYLSGSKENLVILHCPACKTPLQKTDSTCPTCGTVFTSCSLCKFPIFESEEQVQCSFCGSSFHKTEFLEWIKIHARCPICETKITSHDR